jgi:hypothetical protein
MSPARAYDPAKYQPGSLVRILPRSELEAFARSWKYHHPLQPEQLLSADVTAKVQRSFMYHGGDMLYELEGIPGIWHEQCLSRDVN